SGCRERPQPEPPRRDGQRRGARIPAPAARVRGLRAPHSPRPPAESGMTLRPRRGGPPRAPRLVLRFALLTGVSLAIASVAIFVMVRGFVTTQARDAVEQNTRFVAEAVLARELEPQDFAPGRPHARDKSLTQLFRQKVMLDDIEAAALYDVRGRRAFATTEVGRAAAVSTVGAEAIRETLAGKRIRTDVERIRT